MIYSSRRSTHGRGVAPAVCCEICTIHLLFRPRPHKYFIRPSLICIVRAALGKKRDSIAANVGWLMCWRVDSIVKVGVDCLGCVLSRFRRDFDYGIISRLGRFIDLIFHNIFWCYFKLSTHHYNIHYNSGDFQKFSHFFLLRMFGRNDKVKETLLEVLILNTFLCQIVSTQWWVPAY